MRRPALWLATASLLTTGVAAAQRQPPPLSAEAVQRALADLDDQIGAELRRGALPSGEAARMRRQVRDVAALTRKYAPGGLTAEELSDIRQSVQGIATGSSGGAVAHRTDTLLTLLALSPSIWNDKPPPSQPPPSRPPPPPRIPL